MSIIKYRPFLHGDRFGMHPSHLNWMRTRIYNLTDEDIEVLKELKRT